MQRLFRFLTDSLLQILLMASVTFDPAGTRDEELPPWEVAEAVAFHEILGDVAQLLDTPAADLVGVRVDEYIARKVVRKGGGHPQGCAVKRIIAKANNGKWYPGKPSRTDEGAKGGRPPVYSAHQKAEVARVAMENKRKLQAPTPRRVRARLPQKCRNPETGAAMSKETIHRIYKVQCMAVPGVHSPGRSSFNHEALARSSLQAHLGRHNAEELVRACCH